MIEATDEWLHDYGTDPAWQESFYFNWADPERRAFTLARIGYRFNVSKIDGLVISIRDGQLEILESSGARHRIRAEALASFPILRDDVWLEETHVAYTLESDHGRRDGQGVVEHVWRASADDIRLRAQRLMDIVPALRP